MIITEHRALEGVAISLNSDSSLSLKVILLLILESKIERLSKSHMSRCSLRKKQRFFFHAAANMMDSRWRYPLDDNSRTQWISGKFDNWFLEKNKKYRICQSTSKTYEYSYFWSGKQVSFIHAHPHMSFFLLPRNPHEWSICCEWDAVSAFLWSLL